MGAMFGKIAVETPKYEVLVTKPLYEIRKYAPFVMVSTTTEDMVGGNSSFSRLARYIGVFGKAENSTQETISMTAPVVTGLGPSMTGTGGAEETAGSMKMSFVLPSSYNDPTKTPAPNDDSVSLTSVHWGTVACVTFSGWASVADVTKHEAELLEVLKGEGHRITGSSMLARYNPPWTLGPLRKNELLIPVTPAPWVPNFTAAAAAA
mmetsp:Transcript_30571/g.51501  ORF Transcript_30571/g.51501 Transcript_30571/m.51501 type:complete len:207 (-) Transcript_30571:414-1034(-)|eukprot:CAMPEP_0198206252 /NCGR_PEP_ID=MMETSP1445-20131203/9786_1 /TAXON_ID=36898 /ORGANISM="Pyramimonas sp., Strain CCMP2087" /LENGTH=206 /DNA_ID=CAMNT_0043878871 /DNA_START=82 /DNA_END=702 /DNA_ORIENTATION=-